MNVAIIVRQETADRCGGKGCLNAFFQRKDAFVDHPEDAQLITFTHHGGDWDHKVSRMIESGVDVVHLSTCMRAKCPEYAQLAEELSKHFKVIGYSHGSEKEETIRLDKVAD